MTAPIVLQTANPEFSEAARKAGVGGTVLVTLRVDVDGKPKDVRVVRGVGMGLDEKAVEAVSRYVFRPGDAGRGSGRGSDECRC